MYCRSRGTLALINKEAKTCDRRLAQSIRAGEVDALILVSAHFGGPGATNHDTLAAAVATRTPCLGTGGTSLGQAVDAGAVMLQLSGSVATTADSRAASTAAALARHWRMRFRPQLPPAELSILPLLDALLPLVLTISVLSSLASKASVAIGGQLPESAVLRATIMLPAATAANCLSNAPMVALPVALAALSARRAAQLGESGLLAGVLAGSLVAVRPPLTPPEGHAGGNAGGADGLSAAGLSAAGLVAGLVAGLAARRAHAHTHVIGLPATASTLLTVGASGALGGASGALLSPYASVGAATLRAALRGLASAALLPLPARCALGGAMGVMTKGGSILGFYHALMFPLILLEMAEGELSLLGAFDACCLCCVCAGVVAAVSLQRATAPSAVAACRQAMRVNLGLGDYVEACYPYMERSRGTNRAAYAAAALAGAVLLASGTMSSAYLPMPLAIGLSNEPATMALASGVAFGVAFAGTLLSSSSS